MIATFINMATVLAGSLLGLFFGKRLGERSKEIVYVSIGLITLLIGLSMAMEGTRVIYMAVSLILGGAVGTTLDLEGRILAFGEFLSRVFLRSSGEGARRVGTGFLDASVLFCVGAMAILGAFKAGVEGDLEILLTKSMMDGFMAILMTAALGIGVAFSALSLLIYQGGLTLLSGLLAPYVTDLMISEITGVGGLMIVMISLNLLGLKKIKTANFMPAIIIIVLAVVLEPLVIQWIPGVHQ